jgi:serine/threonine protein kinase
MTSILPCGKCRNVEEFTKLGRLGEGTYGTVYKAKDTKTNEIVALKRVKIDIDNDDGMPITSLREIHILKQISHPNIVKLQEIVVGSRQDSVFLAFEFCDHDMSKLIDQRKTFVESEVKTLLRQLLCAVDYLHERNVIHRDIKMSNLLYTNRGQLKLADFGLARVFGKPDQELTPRVVTLWYRPIELLLGATSYSQSIDIWAVGCVFGELLLKEPVFPGKSEMHQLSLIFNLLGYPSEKIWPDYRKLPIKIRVPVESFSNLHHRFRKSCSDSGTDLLERMLTFDPKKRITAKEALKHPYFNEKPYPKAELFMPTYKSSFEN